MTDIRRWAAWLLVPALMVSAAATAQEYRKKTPEGAEVYIITPRDGATLKSPVVVRFGLKGMGIAPAGMAKEKTGHHHVPFDPPVMSKKITITIE